MAKARKMRPAGFMAKLVCALVAVALALTSLFPTAARAEIKHVTKDESFYDTVFSSENRVGVLLGGLSETECRERYPNSTLEVYSTLSDLEAALAAGKVDYALVPEAMANLYMEANDGFVYYEPQFTSYPSCFAAAKGNTELVEKVNTVLKKFREDGTLDQIYKKWVTDADYSMDDVPKVESGETLTVAAMLTEIPYSFVKDGNYVGSDREVIERVAYELGMKVEYLDTDFAGGLTAVSSGKADLAIAVTPNEERAKTMDFTDSYMDLPFSIMGVDPDAKQAGFIETFEKNFKSTFLDENRWQMILSGLGVTCLIACFAFVLATLGGAALCAMRRSSRPLARGFAKTYIKLATGIPVLVWLMILYYILFANVDVSSILVAIICFGLQASAPMSGIFLTGLEGVDKGQLEGALAMGFSKQQAYKMVILPQAANKVFGLWAGQLASLIKGTSVVGYIAITDLTKVSDIIRSRTFQAFFPLIATALVYFAIIALTSWALGLAAKKTDPKRRSGASILKGVKTK